MHELGTELGRFIGGSIDDMQLRAAFREYLEGNPDQREVVASWLKDSVQSGRLSASVWLSLRDLFDAAPAHAAAGPTALTPRALMPDSDLAGATRIATRPPAARQAPSHNSTQRAPLRASSPPQQTSGPLQTGMIVRERFVLMEELGSGGMGKVFKARDLRREEAQDRNPFIALKILKSEVSAHPDSFMALQREARRAGSLAHPNVVTVYDFDRDGDRIYMTMEYLEGRPLDSWLRNEYAKGIPLAQAWAIISAVGAALEAGHHKRIVHSDLKPGNIFVCADGTVKVLDFGISRLVRPTDGKSDETIFDPGKRLGGLTPAYASLEMWTQDTPDPRDDIYALACVSYELLTGKHPFNRASARDVKEKKLVPQRITALTRRQWESIRKGLALRRAQRTGSVREFLQDLEPRSALRRFAKPLMIGAAIVSVAAVVVGAQFYRVAVEDSTMEVLQCAEVIRPAAITQKPAATELTPERRRELDENVLLASDSLAGITAETPLEELKYILSDGPNSVNDVLNSVLADDPKHAEALRLKAAAAEIYAQRAQQSLDRNRSAEALDLVRYARLVQPASQALFRLEQTACRADALATKAQKTS